MTNGGKDLDHKRRVEEALRRWAERHEGRGADLATEGEKRDEYWRLTQMGNEKGYKAGWAAYKFKELFGQWPPKAWGKAGPRREAKAKECPHCGGAL